jgi:hypothetical protein
MQGAMSVQPGSVIFGGFAIGADPKLANNLLAAHS